MKNNKKKTWLLTLPFFLVFAAVTVFAWILPLRPTTSLREKRDLEAFPSFSLSALADGSYFEQIGLWFSDTFPGRDTWINASQKVGELYGKQDIMIYGDARQIPDEIPAASTVPAEPEKSAEPTTAPTAEAEPEETAPEEVTETPEAEREDWSGDAIQKDELVSIGALIQIGDTVYSFGGFSPGRCDQYAKNITKAADLLDGKCRVFDIFFVNSTSVMLPREYREQIGAGLEEDAHEYVNSVMGDNVYCVDTWTPLLEHNDEYIYFRTDHHWTALGAYYAYEEWARTAGFEPVSLSEYTENIYEPFYGSVYYQANQSSLLTPDQVYAYTPPGNIHLYINDENNDTLTRRGYEQDVMADVHGTDKYMCFLRGDHALATLVNEDIEDDSAVLLIKNSNGNPFSYYLTQHYHYVYVIDYRKYYQRSLTAFCDYYDIDDVIFCFSSDQAQGSKPNSILAKFIK